VDGKLDKDEVDTILSSNEDELKALLNKFGYSGFAEQYGATEAEVSKLEAAYQKHVLSDL